MPRPSRRSNIPRLARYQRYKPYLRQDFLYVCAYCGVHENESGGPRYFTIDHYRPKSRFPALLTEYANLLYACAVCNEFKADDWPAEDPLAAGMGYLDPCEHDLSAHIGPDSLDTVIGLTPVGRYMVERLHLNRGLLRKLRRLRHADEQLHLQFLALVERNIRLLEAELAAADLKPRQRKALEQDLAAVRRQYQQRVETWERRWEPLFELEDYR